MGAGDLVEAYSRLGLETRRRGEPNRGFPHFMHCWRTYLTDQPKQRHRFILLSERIAVSEFPKLGWTGKDIQVGEVSYLYHPKSSSLPNMLKDYWYYPIENETGRWYPVLRRRGIGSEVQLHVAEDMLRTYRQEGAIVLHTSCEPERRVQLEKMGISLGEDIPIREYYQRSLERVKYLREKHGDVVFA